MTPLQRNRVGISTTDTAESGAMSGVAEMQKSRCLDAFWMSSGKSRQQTLNNASL